MSRITSRFLVKSASEGLSRGEVGITVSEDWKVAPFGGELLIGSIVGLDSPGADATEEPVAVGATALRLPPPPSMSSDT